MTKSKEQTILDLIKLALPHLSSINSSHVPQDRSSVHEPVTDELERVKRFPEEVLEDYFFSPYMEKFDLELWDLLDRNATLDALEAVRTMCDKVLLGSGWPQSHERIAYAPEAPKTTWRRLKDGEQLGAGELGDYSEAFVEKHAPPDSHASFAAKVLKKFNLLFLLLGYDEKRPNEISDELLAACVLGFAISGHLSSWSAQNAWIDLIETGKRMRETGRKNAERNAKPRLKEKRFARMKELIGEVGVDKAAAQASCEGLGTPSAIKKQWNEAAKKREVERLRKEKGN